MPRPRKNGGSNGAASQPTFVQIHFNDQERLEANLWIENNTLSEIDCLLQVIDEGGKVSMSFSEYYDCYFGTITVRNGDAKKPAISYSFRHNDYTKIVKLVAFVWLHFVNNPLWAVEEEGKDLDW